MYLLGVIHEVFKLEVVKVVTGWGFEACAAVPHQNQRGLGERTTELSLPKSLALSTALEIGELQGPQGN